eukprot:gene20717-33488_t
MPPAAALPPDVVLRVASWLGVRGWAPPSAACRAWRDALSGAAESW